MLGSNNAVVGTMSSYDACTHAIRSANAHQSMLLLLASIHERIRLGKVLFTGSESDVRMWDEIRKVLR